MSFSIYHNMFSISFYLLYLFFENGYFLVFFEIDMMNFIHICRGVILEIDVAMGLFVF
jgi:hypothetical protein